MILGWGTVDMSLDGMEQYFSRYTDVSDVRIFWSGLLGMIGIIMETMSFFGVYRIIASRSESYACIWCILPCYVLHNYISS